MEDKNNNGKKNNSEYIEKLENHINNTDLNIKYSLDRFDILIISLSSGGLVLSMGFVKDILSEEIEVNYFLLKLSWVLFGASLISNLLSQVSSYYANIFEQRISKNIIRQKKGKHEKGDNLKYECKKKFSDNLTKILNFISLALFICAVILLVVFMSINLK